MTGGSPVRLLLQFSIPILIGNLFRQAYTLADRIIVGRFVGDAAFSAISATNALSMMFMSMCMGAAIVTYTGQNMGAGKQERISQGVAAAMKISAAVSAVLLVVFWGFGQPIMGIFVTNAEIISIAATGIRITSLFFIALGGVQILRYMLNGAGDSMYALMNGAVEVIARVAFAVGLTAIPFIGMWGIWLTTGLTWAVTALFALVRYKHGAWKTKKLV